MKYFLAINNNTYKESDKRDQFSIIDLKSFGDYEDTIESISHFTAKFSSEEELMNYLLKNGKITTDQLQNKHLVICYKGKKSIYDEIGCWKKLSKRGTNGVLLNGNDELLNFNNFEDEMFANELFIPDYIDINNCLETEKIKFYILKELCNHLRTNPAYSHYGNVFEDCYRNIYTYLHFIESDHLVSSEYFYRPMKSLAKLLAYDKRMTKDGSKYVLNTTKLFKFLLYYIAIKENVTAKITIASKKEALLKQKDELLKQKDELTKRQEDINKEIDNLNIEEEKKRTKQKYIQTTLF